MEINEIVKTIIQRSSNILKFKWIIIHHSATPDQKTKDWKAIERYHVRKLGWQAIGYHYGIEKVNDEVNIFPGRNLDRAGAHAGIRGVSNVFNTSGIGICIVGNYDKSDPDPEIYEKAILLCKHLCYYFNIDVSHVLGHNEIFDFFNLETYKTCPGKNFNMNKFRSLINP